MPEKRCFIDFEPHQPDLTEVERRDCFPIVFFAIFLYDSIVNIIELKSDTSE